MRLLKDFEEMQNDPPYVSCAVTNCCVGDQRFAVEYGRPVCLGCHDIRSG